MRSTIVAVLTDIVGRVEEVERSGRRRLRGTDRPRHGDGRKRRRAAAEHAVRQHFAASGRRVVRCGGAGNIAPSVRRPAAGITSLRHRLGVARTRADRIGAEAAGPVSRDPRPAGGAFRTGRSGFRQGRSRAGGSAVQSVRRAGARLQLRRITRAARSTGHPTRYIPSLTGNLDQLRSQALLAREEGLDCAMVAPMVAGFPAVQALIGDFPDLAFFCHPSLGALRDRARLTDRQAVPTDRRRRRDLSKLRWPVRLQHRNVPCSGQQRAAARQRHATCVARPGGWDDAGANPGDS